MKSCRFVMGALVLSLVLCQTANGAPPKRMGWMRQLVQSARYGSELGRFNNGRHTLEHLSLDEYRTYRATGRIPEHRQPATVLAEQERIIQVSIERVKNKIGHFGTLLSHTIPPRKRYWAGPPQIGLDYLFVGSPKPRMDAWLRDAHKSATQLADHVRDARQYAELHNLPLSQDLQSGIESARSTLQLESQPLSQLSKEDSRWSIAGGTVHERVLSLDQTLANIGPSLPPPPKN